MSEPVTIEVGAAHLRGDLTVRPESRGLIIFAHGSGSSRLSPRNQHVASFLVERGLGTLLMDLLTEAEEVVDRRTAEFRFDIQLLAQRLAGTTGWVSQNSVSGRLPIGYFGASTGAAAALVAAARSEIEIGAIVSRGGRPDLAGPAALRAVRAPTLLIVGGEDTEVLTLNRKAASSLRAPHEISIVPGATHLFEEPGALDQVAALAATWFIRHLNPPSPSGVGQE